MLHGGAVGSAQLNLPAAADQAVAPAVAHATDLCSRPAARVTTHTSALPYLPLAGADLALLPLLGDEDLKQMGIAALGARKKLLLGASELAAGCSGTVPWGTAADAPPVGVAEVAGGPSGGDASGWDEEDEPAVDSYGPIPMLGAAAAAPAAAAAKCGAGAAAGGPEGTGGGSVGEWRALSGTGGATLFCGNIRRYFLPDPRLERGVLLKRGTPVWRPALWIQCLCSLLAVMRSFAFGVRG